MEFLIETIEIYQAILTELAIQFGLVSFMSLNTSKKVFLGNFSSQN